MIYTAAFPGPDSLAQKQGWSLECVEKLILETLSVLGKNGHHFVHKYVVAHDHCAGHDVDHLHHCVDVVETVNLLNKRNTYNPRFLPLIAVRGEDDFLWSVQPVH